MNMNFSIGNIIVAVVILSVATPIFCALNMEQPWALDSATLTTAREGGTGFFYTTGWFRGTVTLARKDICNVESCYKVPSLRFQSQGSADIYIAKYNPRNQLVWAKNAGGLGDDRASSVVLADFTNGIYNSVYITGYTQGQAYFGSKTSSVISLSSLSKSLFIAKYNTTQGNLLWVQEACSCDTTDVHSSAGATSTASIKDAYSHCESRAISVDTNNDVIITGKFYGTLNFPNGVRLISSTNCWVRSGTGRVCQHDIFVAKFSKSGAFQWADKIGNVLNSSEFNQWADKAIALYSSLEPSSDRVADNYPSGTSGNNRNLYQTPNV